MAARIAPAPGTLPIATVVAMLCATPFLAATTLRPFAIRWDLFFGFLSAHRVGLLLGFSLAAVVALLLRRRQRSAPGAQRGCRR